ncbi:two-pore potassium channel 1-like [Chenopodium quinoa]|uniref:Potassium channel domain-containing protein n=1 Tax=Chenopodium quinoa TaxID=63459 RepID=A0A803MWK0_CHEQI|nr:two-pore potassium channel 1-like [Chenopodium quinoa]
MANNNDLKESLISKPSNRKDAVKKRRFRRVKSAPLAELIPGEVDGSATSARISESVFGSLHPSLIGVAAYLFIYLVVGVICFYLVRHHISGQKTNDVVDALYLTIVTMTTVGYGDLVPQSVSGKLLACAFVFIGMALVGLVLSRGADYLVEKQEALMVKALHMRQKLGPSDIMKEIETNKSRYKFILSLIFLLILIMIGTLFLTFVEKLDIVDAFYCVCCTITTLGYGDRSFSTKGGRLFAVVWILTSTICLAQFFLYLTEINTEKRQKYLVHCVLTRHMTNVDLEAADIDDDGVVNAAEFVLYKLKELGKITQDDISLMMEEFEELDVDQSGTLSVSDLALAQSSPQAKGSTSDQGRPC